MSKLTLFSAMALFLMVADVRFNVTQPLRLVVASALRPVQWVVMQPIIWAQGGGQYLESLQTAQSNEAVAQQKMGRLSQRANQVEQLMLENTRLRELLTLRQRIAAPSQAAQVLYDAADPYARKVIIDLGLTAGVKAGSAVMDESGVLGQVTRVYPYLSEVTLVTDRDQAIPVLNTRTGVRGIAYGDGSLSSSGMELRYMPANADVQVGDLLSTSGVDGLYPPGLPVAQVERIERRSDSAFARIYCKPIAQTSATAHVMVLTLVDAQVADRPAADSPPSGNAKKGAKK